MSRTFQATLSVTLQGSSSVGRVDLDEQVVADLRLRPDETVRASLRGSEFLGRVHGGMSAPSLLIPMEVITKLGLREGQGVRVQVIGRP